MRVKSFEDSEEWIALGRLLNAIYNLTELDERRRSNKGSGVLGETQSEILNSIISWCRARRLELEAREDV